MKYKVHTRWIEYLTIVVEADSESAAREKAMGPDFIDVLPDGNADPIAPRKWKVEEV